MESDADDALGRFARRSYQFCIRSRCLIITLHTLKVNHHDGGIKLYIRCCEYAENELQIQ